MAFFQNLFNQEFRGNWVLGDRQHSITFSCPANRNSSEYQLAYNNGPWDFSASGSNLSLNYSIDLKNYSSISIDVSGADVSATAPLEVVSALNNNATFSSIWKAEMSLNGLTVLIKPKNDPVRVWVSNSGAEVAMKFNKHAGVAELPSYFERHTIENSQNFPDSVGQLIKLDETDLSVDVPVIEDAGFSVAEMKEDWELLQGRASGLFKFQKLTVDGSNRITEIIEYPTGAVEGDFAKKINYSYTGSNTNPNKVTEIPYVLKSADLVSP